MKKEILIKVLQTLPEYVTEVIIVHRNGDSKKEVVISRDFAIDDCVKLKSDEYTDGYAALVFSDNELSHIRGVEVDKRHFLRDQEKIWGISKEVE